MSSSSSSVPLIADAEFAGGDADKSSSNVAGCVAGRSRDCADDDALYGLLIIGTCFDLEKPAENCGADSGSDGWSGSVFGSCSCSPFGRRFRYFLFTLLTSSPAAAAAGSDAAAAEERGVSVSDSWCRWAGCSAGHFS